MTPESFQERPGQKANPESKDANNPDTRNGAASEREGKLRAVADDFLGKEKAAAAQPVAADAEYTMNRVDESLGYLPFLEHLLEEMKDKDEWTWDGADEAAKEKALLQSAALAVRTNIKKLSDALGAVPDTNGKEYGRLRSLYLDRAKRLTELTASVHEEEENAELRNAQLAVEQAQEMLPHMGMDEAIDWVAQTLAAIDGNDWQSSGLKETYGLLINACKAGLQKKIAEEKGSIGNDPAKASAFCGHAMELATLFTDRGSPIDSDLTDIDFAAGMAKDAMGFEELAMRYMEKTLGEKNPLKEYVSDKKRGVLDKIAALPEGTRTDPQVLEMQRKIDADPMSIQEISEQYAILRTLEAQFNGEKTTDIQGEINGKMTAFLENAYETFERFLDGDMGGAANLQDIDAAVGAPGMTAMQIEAWTLLSDIQGYGYDIGDKTWSYVAAGAKIGGMIAAGIAVGIATGGLGVVAAALAGGAAMTGVNAVVNQQGFDNLDDALKTYGKDFAINATTMGAARYLSAGRAAYQLSRAGLLKDAGGLSKITGIAGQKGGARILGSIDDASSIGTRLAGATLEGTADLALGTTLDTAITGGEFLDNLKNNAMFFGLGYAEFAGAGLRKLRGLPNEDLHGLAQTVNKANMQRINIQKITGGVSLEELLSSADPADLLRKNGVGESELKQVFEELDGLRKTKAEFEAAFEKAAALPDAPNAAAPQSDEEKIEVIKTTIMALPDTAEGLAKRVEGGAFVLGLKATDLSETQAKAILDAHAVKMKDGKKYSPAELKQKMQILKQGGFTREQVATLLRMGVCGVAPPPVLKNKAFGVPPPPVLPNRRNANTVTAADKPRPQPKALEKVSVTLTQGLPANDRATNRPTTVKPGQYEAMITQSGIHVILEKVGSGYRMYEVQPGTIFEASKTTAPAVQPQAPKAAPSAVQRNTPSVPPPPAAPRRPAASPSPTPSGSPSQAPRAPKLSVSPALQATINKAAKLGHEAPDAMPPSLQRHLAALADAPVMAMAHMTFVRGKEAGKTVGYRNMTNKRSADAFVANGIKVENDSSKIGGWFVREDNTSYDPLFIPLQKPISTKLNLSQTIEIVNVDTQKDGMALLRYNYFNYGNLDSAGRRGTPLNIAILLPMEQAKAIQAELKQHPDSVRTFFIAAAQDVDRADYIWTERAPNYADITKQRMFFTESTRKDNTDSAGSYRMSIIKNEGSAWVADTPTQAEARLIESHQRYLQPRQTPATQPEPKKGFLASLFG